jgi:hypothetical protein
MVVVAERVSETLKTDDAGPSLAPVEDPLLASITTRLELLEFLLTLPPPLPLLSRLLLRPIPKPDSAANGVLS